MYLFIFESIGTSELLMIGAVALMFLGPRKLPVMARKIGKIMSEFRSTTHEFKETWQREVNFEEETKAFNLDIIEAETVSHTQTVTVPKSIDLPEAPAIKQVDPASFEHLPKEDHADSPGKVTSPDANSKENWL